MEASVYICTFFRVSRYSLKWQYQNSFQIFHHCWQWHWSCCYTV